MHTIHVGLAERTYPVHIGHGTLADIGGRCADLELGSRVAVVADTNVAPHYLDPVLNSLQAAGFQPGSIPFSGGDPAKTLNTADRILAELIRAGYDRSAWILAAGGGVVGDLAGFVASVFLRGIPFVQLPTSLLAQVDASVGGKVAVNHALGKNLVGAFHQPRLVWIDTRVLQTLPRRELVGGLAEIVKHAVIRDPHLFEFLEKRLESIVSLECPPDELNWLIARNVEIKAAVVAADERESGLRMILNYGHTVGHAIESATSFQQYRHGEAVILGMMAAGEIAVGRQLWSRDERDRHDALLLRLPLPAGLELPDPDRVIERVHSDKKRLGGRLRFVLPTALGAVKIVEGIEEAEIAQALHHVSRMCCRSR